MKSTSHGHVEVAHQVGEEEDRALQDADEQQVPALVVREISSASCLTRCARSSRWTRISPMAGSVTGAGV